MRPERDLNIFPSTGVEAPPRPTPTPTPTLPRPDIVPPLYPRTPQIPTLPPIPVRIPR